MWCVGIIVMRCFLPDPAPAGDTYCQIAKPLYWSKVDTVETKRQADRHNRVWKKLCQGPHK